MDTEYFLLKRQVLVSRMQSRRAQSFDGHPLRLVRDSGLPFPIWSKWLLALLPPQRWLTQALGLMVPIITPYIMRRQKSVLHRLFDLLVSSRA